MQHIKGDRYIWLIVVLLAFTSILAVYSSTFSLAFRSAGGNTEYYLFKHGIIWLISMGVIYVIHKVHFKYLNGPAMILVWITAPLLVYTLIWGVEINDASRWIQIPLINLTFQPSDLAKLTLVLYLAKMIVSRQKDIKDFWSGFVPLILPVVVICGLVAPADLSTAILLFITSMILLFVGRVNMTHLGGFLALCAFGVLIAGTILYITPDSAIQNKGRLLTWKNRVETFVNPNETPYQVQETKKAIANGGVFGQGPGQGMQKNYLPHSYSDFIYAVIIEEYGLIGGILVMALFLTLLYRSLVIFHLTIDAFGGLLAFGLMLNIVLQAFINMAVNVSLVPVTGMPMPFVSMGGNSLLFTALATGIILSVSHFGTLKTQKRKKVAIA